MPDLAQQRERIPGTDYSWAGSAHGFDAARSGTIDFDTLEAEHYSDGYLPSGFVVGRITATGKFGPYDPEAVDGRDTPVGVVIDNHTVNEGDISMVSILVHGILINNRLPFPLDEAGIEALKGQFIVIVDGEGS